MSDCGRPLSLWGAWWNAIELVRPAFSRLSTFMWFATIVAGMTVRSGDLIHADRHGAVVIPLDVAAKLPEAAELCGRRETPILEIARSKDFTLEKLKEALKRSAEIH